MFGGELQGMQRIQAVPVTEGAKYTAGQLGYGAAAPQH